MELNIKKTINGWAMYDWANSVYSLVITSAIFPIYYNSVTTGADGNDKVDFFGIEVINTVLYSYALSFSFLVVAAILPILSGIADYAGNKKLFLKVFMYIGSLSCIGLFFFTGENVEWAILCSVFASIGYSGGLVFYDAFLPEIASEDQFDRVSAKGYAMGYIGSVILLIINIAMIQKPEWFGLTDSGLASRVSFLMVGLWWIGFSQITFARLPDNVFGRKPTGSLFLKGYQELKVVWKSLGMLKIMKLFLIAFFFYNMGVQTVMYLAASFGAKELKLEPSALIATILIIQLVAIGGAYLFAFVSKIKGNKKSLLVMVFIWVFICLGAYFVTTENEFYVLAFVVGMVMGGIQSLSRATFSKLIPVDTEDHASYFSFYDVTYNLSIVVGTFSYGFIEQLTNDMRNSVLALILFFVVGLGFLLISKMPDKLRAPKSVT
ncbi:MAG: MFS transporter [Bacteroidota bacterium]